MQGQERGGGKRLLPREGRLVVVGDLRPGGGGDGGEERCRRRKVAEERRGGDAGVNTPVISVKCAWAQLASRCYYCSYARGLEISVSGARLFFFFFSKRSLWLGMNGSVTRDACGRRGCFGFLEFGKGRIIFLFSSKLSKIPVLR